jgi:hypothetical protein
VESRTLLLDEEACEKNEVEAEVGVHGGRQRRRRMVAKREWARTTSHMEERSTMQRWEEKKTMVERAVKGRRRWGQKFSRKTVVS